jgi:ribosomal protein S20
MIYPMMLLGIGFLTACVLMAMLAPLIHERAVRLTVRRLSAKRPRSVIDRRAHEDHLRAQFAVSIRRLQTAVEDAQAKAAGQLCDAARRSADVDRLKTELRKRNIVILRFQARELMRRSALRTIIKLIIFLYARAQRQSGRTLPAPAFRRQPRKRELGAVSA